MVQTKRRAQTIIFDKYKHNNRRMVGCIMLCAVHVLSKENMCVCMCIPPPIVARQLFSKHIPMATKNCWTRHFLCGPCDIKGK
jgi:hypothetical protein